MQQIYFCELRRMTPGLTANEPETRDFLGLASKGFAEVLLHHRSAKACSCHLPNAHFAALADVSRVFFMNTPNRVKCLARPLFCESCDLVGYSKLDTNREMFTVREGGECPWPVAPHGFEETVLTAFQSFRCIARDVLCAVTVNLLSEYKIDPTKIVDEISRLVEHESSSSVLFLRCYNAPSAVNAHTDSGILTLLFERTFCSIAVDSEPPKLCHLEFLDPLVTSNDQWRSAGGSAERDCLALVAFAGEMMVPFLQLLWRALSDPDALFPFEKFGRLAGVHRVSAVARSGSVEGDTSSARLSFPFQLRLSSEALGTFVASSSAQPMRSYMLSV